MKPFESIRIQGLTGNGWPSLAVKRVTARKHRRQRRARPKGWAQTDHPRTTQGAAHLEQGKTAERKAARGLVGLEAGGNPHLAVRSYILVDLLRTRMCTWLVDAAVDAYAVAFVLEGDVFQDEKVPSHLRACSDASAGPETVLADT